MLSSRKLVENERCRNGHDYDNNYDDDSYYDYDYGDYDYYCGDKYYLLTGVGSLGYAPRCNPSCSTAPPSKPLQHSKSQTT